MRKPVLLIFTNACILVVVFALLAQSLFIVQRVAIARAVSGQVEVQRGGAGAFTPLSAGEGVKSGDVVRTAGQSEAEFAWQDGTRWKLAPGSRLTVEKASLNSARQNQTSRFQLESGRILVRVVRPMTRASRFEIATPNAVASVRGTVFSVAVANGATQVKVFRGSVEVSELNGTQKVSVAPGQKVRASLLDFKTSADSDEREFLAQPDFLQPELRVNAQVLENGVALLRGQTEAGDAVTIDGASVPVLTTGAFVQRVQIGAKTLGWKVESTDRHGAKTVIWQRAPLEKE